MAETLPFSKKIAYAFGQWGWATLVSIINLQLVYFYIPPKDAGIETFITQTVFLLVLNAIVLIAASGRLLDAITDPLIASMSDRWKGKNGRRIPFMKVGAIPSAFFCFLLFVPIVPAESGWNIIWLIFVQACFYVSLTIYVTPYFALLPELGHNAKERLSLSTWISITYALGVVVAAVVPVLGDVLKEAWMLTKVQSIQYAVGILAGVATIFLLIPVWFIEEKKYCKSIDNAIEVPVMTALKRTFKNKNFIYYVVADFTYFMGFTIINTGLLYYITVLLGFEEGEVIIYLAGLIGISFVFYPIVNILAKSKGKKPLVVGSFLWLGVVFTGIFFLGNLPFSADTQAKLLILSLAVPISFLGILPNAILADIAEHDALKSGIRQEGMYFASRTLMQKFGQTVGVVLFAMLTSLGKDPGDDLGIRLSGIIGAVLCVLSGLYFINYNEKQLLQEIEDNSQ